MFSCVRVSPRHDACGVGRCGTTHFYRVATAYVMLNNLRVTLAIRFVRAEDETVTIVPDLQNALKRLKIRVQRLFLDKGFGGIALMAELEHQGQPTVIACTIRGKTGGTRALCQGNKSYTHLTARRSPAHTAGIMSWRHPHA